MTAQWRAHVLHDGDRRGAFDGQPDLFAGASTRERERLARSVEGKIEAQELRYRAMEARQASVRMRDVARRAKAAGPGGMTGSFSPHA